MMAPASAPPAYAEPKLRFGEGRSGIETAIGNYRAALQDMDQVIRLRPNSAQSYYSRGILNLILDNNKQGVMDIATAKQIYLNSGNYQDYQKIISWENDMKASQEQWRRERKEASYRETQLELQQEQNNLLKKQIDALNQPINVYINH